MSFFSVSITAFCSQKNRTSESTVICFSTKHTHKLVIEICKIFEYILHEKIPELNRNSIFESLVCTRYRGARARLYAEVVADVLNLFLSNDDAGDPNIPGVYVVYCTF